MDSGALTELLKWGIGGVVVGAVFWKFIPSLFEFLDKQKAKSHEHDHAKWAHQSYINDSFEKRLDGIDARLSEHEKRDHEVAATLADIGAAIRVSNAILDRIESGQNG